MVGIYKITNPLGEVYIGQSLDIQERWNSYKSAKCEVQRKLFYSFFNYGILNHTFEVVHELPLDVSIETINRYEQFYIDSYRDCNVRLLNMVDVPMITKRRKSYRTVYQYSLEGDFIKEWYSSGEASRHLGISKSSINSVINGFSRNAGGFIWLNYFELKIKSIKYTNQKGKTFLINVN